MKNSTNEVYQTLIRREKMYCRIVESALEMIIIHSDGKILYINQSGVKFLRASSKEEIIGKSMFDIVSEECWEMVKKRVQDILEEDKPTEQVEKKIKRFDGTLVDVEINCTLVSYEDKKAIQTVYRDITQRKETEKTLKKALQEISELSAPLVPVLEGIAVLPLVGSIDQDRAKHLLEHIPSKITEQNVHCLIIDFSGLYTLDTTVTDHLFKINAILRLLGVRSIITGIRPELAQAAIQLEVDLSSVQTFSTVQQALRELGVGELSNRTTTILHKQS